MHRFTSYMDDAFPHFRSHRIDRVAFCRVYRGSDSLTASCLHTARLHAQARAGTRSSHGRELAGWTAALFMSKLARTLVSKKKRRYQQDGFDLDLTYIVSTLTIASGILTANSPMHRTMSAADIHC